MEFVSFELAKKLKEKGYPQITFGEYNMGGSTYFEDGRFYENGCICHKDEAYTAPTISQVLKWLREEKNIHVSPVLWYKGWYVDIQSFTKEIDEERVHYDVYNEFQSTDYETYEESVIAGIEYVLNNLI